MKRLLLLLAFMGIAAIGFSKDEVGKGNDNKIESTVTQNQRCCLYYTSSDGMIMEPSGSSSFDAAILSNTYKDGIGIIEFNAPITTIGNRAFSGCRRLTSVTIPDSVTTIGDYAFYYCSRLTSVTIGDSVTTIGDSSFKDCSSLTSITIPDSVTTIGDRAFADCSSLTSVTISDSVTTIGVRAFRHCSSLTSVYCKPTTPPTGGSYMFDSNAYGRKIYVPMESVASYKSASSWSKYANAIVGYNF